MAEASVEEPRVVVALAVRMGEGEAPSVFQQAPAEAARVGEAAEREAMEEA